MTELRGKAVLITGGGSGIGAHLATTLAGQPYCCKIMAADKNVQAAERVVQTIKEAGGKATACECDVTDPAAQRRMFERHIQVFGALDIAVLNAGILETGEFWQEDDEKADWRRVLQIDLEAQIEGCRLAAACMRSHNTHGVILFTASAGGLFPMPNAPVYAAAKAGVINFTKSVARPLSEHGIRVCALCPQPVATPMVTGTAEVGLSQYQALKGQMLTTQQVVDAALHLLEESSLVGALLLLRVSGDAFLWRFSPASMQPLAISSAAEAQEAAKGRPQLVQWATRPPPPTFPKLQVHRLSSNFRDATEVVPALLPSSIPEGCLLMRRAFAGINASDVNFSAGKYFVGGEPPFDAGFESVGAVAAVGPGVSGWEVGQPVAGMGAAFQGWAVVPAEQAQPIPVLAPEIVALLTGGLTASIGLEAVGQMGSNETVFVTAAAGGTGQFVVQLAKAAGNHVIATCGGANKAKLLRKLGADRVIDYRQEDIKEVLKREYPQGVDLIWEAVGGSMFDVCSHALATRGRLIVIGAVSQYTSGWAPSTSKGLPEMLLSKSASLRGFFLTDYLPLHRPHLQRLIASWRRGSLHVALDSTPFRGPEQAADAVEHLHSGKSVGKVYLQLCHDDPPPMLSVAKPAAESNL